MHAYLIHHAKYREPASRNISLVSFRATLSSKFSITLLLLFQCPYGLGVCRFEISAMLPKLLHRVLKICFCFIRSEGRINIIFFYFLTLSTSNLAYKIISKRIQRNFYDRINRYWWSSKFLLFKRVHDPFIFQYGKKTPTSTNLNITSHVHHRTQL